MKISLITVCYNSAATIEDTINSVLSQSYENIEYIVVDGNSTDKTVKIIQEYEPKFNGRLRWISEPDNGLYDAMNKGIEMATGEVVGIINSDDLFCDTDAVHKIANRFTSDKTLDAVYADLYYVSNLDISKIIRKWITGKQKPFKTGWHPAHPALYIKKAIYDKYGLFDLNYKLAADFEIMLRFIDKYKIKIDYMEESIVKMRLGGETNKSIKNIVNQNIECVRAFRKNDIKVNVFLYPLKRLLPKLQQYK
ncbi:MAG: glycosyltransferase [Paludibacter sp.]|jgi:glycosyltransferase involved in cell wall biosynthesis|nr:glycosyltransferase [Paludibacter sp.]